MKIRKTEISSKIEVLSVTIRKSDDKDHTSKIK